MPIDVNKLLKQDLDEIEKLPPFNSIAARCTRQMCRSGALEALAKSGEVEGIGIESVAILFDDAATLIGELMLVIAKLYQDTDRSINIEVDVDSLKAEEAIKFGLGDFVNQEEEECQSNPSSESDKKLN